MKPKAVERSVREKLALYGLDMDTVNFFIKINPNHIESMIAQDRFVHMMTQTEIGDRHNISGSRVFQRIHSFLGKIRNRVNKNNKYLDLDGKLPNDEFFKLWEIHGEKQIKLKQIAESIAKN